MEEKKEEITFLGSVAGTVTAIVIAVFFYGVAYFTFGYMQSRVSPRMVEKPQNAYREAMGLMPTHERYEFWEVMGVFDWLLMAVAIVASFAVIYWFILGVLGFFGTAWLGLKKMSSLGRITGKASQE